MLVQNVHAHRASGHDEDQQPDIIELSQERENAGDPVELDGAKGRNPTVEQRYRPELVPEPKAWLRRIVSWRIRTFSLCARRETASGSFHSR